MNLLECFGLTSQTVPTDDYISLVDNIDSISLVDNTTSNKPPPPYTSRQTTDADAGHVVLIFLDDVNAPAFQVTRATGYPYVFDRRISFQVPWHAELVIRANDVPTLLGQGLFWSEDNIDASKACIVVARPTRFQSPLAHRIEWRHCRDYPMTDTSPDPTWEGTLTVYANDVAVLDGFRPNDLSLTNIRFATASNADNHLVYRYDSAGIVPNLSAIYGDTPLPG